MHTDRSLILLIIIIVVVLIVIILAVRDDRRAPRGNLTSSECGKHPEKSKDCDTCDGCQVITQHDFTLKGKLSKTVRITKPGKWCLKSSVAWKPLELTELDYATPQAAIIIESDGVVLDLCKNTLSQINGVQAVVGILVLSGHKDITIINGVLDGFSYNGIYVQGGQENVRIGNEHDQIIVRNCGYGTHYQYVDDAVTVNINPGGMLVGESLITTPAQFGFINKLKVQNVLIEKCGYTGITLGYFNDVEILKTDICRNFDNREGAPFDDLSSFWGLYHYANADFGEPISTSLTISDCHIDGNSLDAPNEFLSSAYIGYLVDGLKISRCTTNGNFGTNGSTNSSVRGFVIVGNRGVVVEDCNSVGNYGPGRIDGFHYSGVGGFDSITNGKGVVYRNCNSTGHQSVAVTSNREVNGFAILFMRGITVENCTAENNSWSSDNSLFRGTVVGLNLKSNTSIEDPNSVAVKIIGGHYARNSCDSSLSASICAGIVVQAPRDGFAQSKSIIIQNATVQENTGCIQNVGILLSNTSSQALTGVIVQDCTIQGETNGIEVQNTTRSIFQRNTITDVDTGIVLDGLSTCNSINDNYTTNATRGFVDGLVPSTSLFSNNKTFGVAIPFDVTHTFGPVPVVNGSLTTGFPTGAEVMDNTAVNSEFCQRSLISKSKPKVSSSQYSSEDEEDPFKKKLEFFKNIRPSK